MQREAFFDLLERTPSALWVVTSNQRLARSIAHEFDIRQAKRSLGVWETPKIFPFGAFVAELYDAAQHDPDLTGLCAPLTPAQERALWESVVADGELAVLSFTATANLASNAWRQAHQWDIASRVRRYTAGADTRAFVAWATEYQRRVDAIGAVDPAQLPDIVRGLICSGAVSVPPMIVLAGFDEATAQQQQLIDALIARGTSCERFEPKQHAAPALRAQCHDQHDENFRMADWVAARLGENSNARIGVVVPDLQMRRRSLASALDATLTPDRLLAPSGVRPYTISLGGSLADIPLVAFSLRALRVVVGDVSFDEVSALVRSPYLAGANDERDLRDRLDADLRRRCERVVSFDGLLDAVERSARDCRIDAPRLLHCLHSLRDWRRTETAVSRRPSEWSGAIARVLRSITSYGARDRALDSAEFQSLARWQELLAEFAGLDRVVGRRAAAGALAQLERLARETIFQPEGGTPAVQVLGILEANSLDFDHLWIMGLTADAWPPPARPHALLPIELQRAAEMPGASAAIELKRARQLLQRWMAAAPEVVISHAGHEGDRALAPSPLIAALDIYLPVPHAPRLIDALRASTLTSDLDSVAPQWIPSALRGGATVLKDQAACPFRAFAIHRLNARAIDAAHDGLDHSERGQLVHDVLAQFWRAMPAPTRDALAATSFEQRRELLNAAARGALARLGRRRSAPTAALAALETARLVRIVEHWLQYELKHRSDFRVVAVEEARTVQIGPLAFTGRPDRIDQTSDGARVVIDYKTGGPVSGAWLDQRPDEPQLPLYLAALEPDAKAIAFARVRAGDFCLSGLAATPELLPGQNRSWEKSFPDWQTLVDHWSVVLDRLATAFADGDAAVNPKRRPQTCRYCNLPTLCRINERGATIDVDDGVAMARDE